MQPNNNTPAPATPPAAEPAPQFNPAPVASPAPLVQNPNFEEGGMSDKGSKEGFFSNVNWVEVGFGILGATALYYAIFYYKYKLNQDKMINNYLQKQIDELKSKAQTTQQKRNKSFI